MASSRAAQAGPSAAVSRGLWLLPVAGVIIAVVTALWFTGPSGDDPATNAKFMAGGMALIVGGWLYFVGLFALILGIQALYGALATSRG